MRRPWQIWLAYAGCAAVLCAALGWLTLKALELDRAEFQARRHALREENSRLALWRMDTAMAAVVATESAQPPFVYSPFVSYRVASDVPGAPDGDVRRAPSPLLTLRQPQIRLHFEIGPDGEWQSPQVPLAEDRELAMSHGVGLHEMERAAEQLAELQALINPDELRARLPDLDSSPDAPSPTPEEPPALARGQSVQPEPALQQPALAQADQQLLLEPDELPAQQAIRNTIEYQARSQLVGPQSRMNSSHGNYQLNAGSGGWTADGGMSTAMVMTPLWMEGELLLARAVRVGESVRWQGCWLDWPGVREELLTTVRDLLPEADLHAADDAQAEAQARRLAVLPLALSPGSGPPIVEAAGLSPLRLSISVAWVSLACMLLAVGVLLSGVVSLSERRAAFVSAVTHELRTPLTTFRLYAEMLSEGMVRDEQDRKVYLETLRVEADRLTHLVENVLAYARLERGTMAGRVAPIEVDALLNQVEGRLQERAALAGVRVQRQTGAAGRAVVATDAAAVEQILFNLVDNACKYGIGDEKRIVLDAELSRRRVLVKVRDFGPGIAEPARRKLFHPFHKSAHEAASSAPGVGLGLALCRRLARETGARLRLESSTPAGTCFVLELPLAAARPA